jgi:hypothetical protein
MEVMNGSNTGVDVGTAAPEAHVHRKITIRGSSYRVLVALSKRLELNRDGSLYIFNNSLA